MKKLLSILLVLLAATTLFAANDASLGIKTSITAVTGLKISQAAAISNWSTAGITELASPLTKTAVTDLFVNLRTNKKTAFTINIDAPSLVNTDSSVTYKVVYVVTPAAAVSGVTVGSAITSGETAVDKHLMTFAGDVGTGLRILSHGFSIDVDDTSYDNAVEGTYETTIVFDIVVGS